MDNNSNPLNFYFVGGVGGVGGGYEANLALLNKKDVKMMFT